VKICLNQFEHNRQLRDRAVLCQPTHQLTNWWEDEIDNVQELIPIICDSIDKSGEVVTIVALRDSGLHSRSLVEIKHFVQWCVGVS